MFRLASQAKDKEIKQNLVVQSHVAENKSSKKLRVVLDIDNTISTAQPVDDEDHIKKYLSEFKEYGITQDIIQLLVKDKTNETAIFLQVLHPGATEFAKWLYHVIGAHVSFFSSGAEERNKSFVKEFLSLTLGKDEYERIKDSVSVYSRDNMSRSTDTLKETQKKNFGGLFQGSFKKDLKVTLKGDEDLSYTVLVDDDPSYICPEQEKNSLIAIGISGLICFKRKFPDDLLRLNNIFFVTGILKNALEMTLQGGSFLDNLFKLQFKPKDLTYELIWSTSKDQFQYYVDGLKELRKINPHLNLYGSDKLAAHFESEKEKHLNYL